LALEVQGRRLDFRDTPGQHRNTRRIVGRLQIRQPAM
jgi:hypothetical protein